MRVLALSIALVVGSTVLAWFLGAGTCLVLEVTKVRAGDFVCGHNSFFILLFYWIVCLVALPVLWSWIHRQPAPSALLKCSRCGGDVTLDAVVCPRCGFEFEHA